MKEQEHLSARSIFVAIIMGASSGLIYLLPYIRYNYYDSMVAAFNMTNQQCGFLTTMYAVSCMILYIPGGYVADRVSAKKCVVLSLFSTAILGVLMSVSMNYPTALFCYFMYGLTTSFVMWVAVIKVVRMAGPKSAQGRMYGIYYAATGATEIISGSIHLFFYSRFMPNDTAALRAVFLCISCLLVFAGILAAIAYKENPQNSDSEERSDRITVRDIPLVLKNKYVWLAACLMIFVYAINTSSTYFTPYFTSRIGTSETFAAALSLARSFCFLLTPLMGILVDKVFKSTLRTYSWMFTLLAAIYVGVLFIPADSSSLPVAIAVSLLAIACSVNLYGVMWSIMSEIRIPAVYAATATGIASLLIYTPDLFLSTLFGTWLDTYGSDGGFFRIFSAIGCFCAAAVLISLYLRSAVSKMPESKESQSAK